MVVQGPRALPVSPCLYEGRRGCPYPASGSGHQGPQLPRRLAYLGPIQRSVERSQGLGASAGASGQLGKEQALPCAENLFSRCGVRLGEYDGTPHGGTCPSSAELPEFLQRQEFGTAETVSEAPGVSALPQPLDRPCLSTGRGAPRTSVPAYCCHNRCLQHGLGCYMQRAGSLGALDRAPTALAHQLPRAVDSASSLTAISATAVGQARASPHRQHCGCFIYKPVGRYTITLHTAISSSGVTRSSNHCALSRQLTFPREWRLHPETIRLIWSRCGEAQVNLFASHESSHHQLYFPLTEGPLGTDALAHSWPQDLCKYAFPPVSLLAQTLCKLREDEKQVLLVAAAWPTRTCFSKQIILTTAPPWRIPLRNDLLSQGLGTVWHPRPDL